MHKCCTVDDLVKNTSQKGWKWEPVQRIRKKGFMKVVHKYKFIFQIVRREERDLIVLKIYSSYSFLFVVFFYSASKSKFTFKIVS